MWQRYILAFVITAAIFGTAFYIAQRIDAERIAEIRTTESNVSIDILSSETQFELLGNQSCDTIAAHPVLSDELNNLASQLSVAESNLGDDNPEVIELKQQYTLLEIKDFVLLQNISTKCGVKPQYVLYFYSNAGDCTDCTRMGDVLTYMRQTYPTLRVYAFDYNLDLSALTTLKSLNKISGKELPALIINNNAPVYGFKNLDQMLALMPDLKMATSTATSTTKAATSTKK